MNEFPTLPLLLTTNYSPMEEIRTIGEGSHPTPRIPGLGKDDIARIAYASVEELNFLEMNDGNRLGYHIYLYLMGQISSVAEAIYESKSRVDMKPDQLERLLNERLEAAGVVQT